MTIDILDPRQGFTLCIERPLDASAGYQVGGIWKAPSETGSQLFNDLRCLYAPPGEDENSELPFIEYR